jgi:hypothetical protein
MIWLFEQLLWGFVGVALIVAVIVFRWWMDKRRNR